MHSRAQFDHARPATSSKALRSKKFEAGSKHIQSELTRPSTTGGIIQASRNEYDIGSCFRGTLTHYETIQHSAEREREEDPWHNSIPLPLIRTGNQTHISTNSLPERRRPRTATNFCTLRVLLRAQRKSLRQRDINSMPNARRTKGNYKVRKVG